MKTLTYAGSTSYSIYIDHHILESPLLTQYCRALNKRFVIITDSNLKKTWGEKLKQFLLKQKLEVNLLSFKAGETYKTRETKQTLEDALMLQNYGRDTCLIALGGGVVTDLAGFLGATYQRGMPVIYMPTTLLAMVDASLGGKTGVNTFYGKNLIGTFTQPHAVFIDTHTLSTLPQEEWGNGWAEIIKHSLIADSDLFYLLEENISPVKFPNHKFLIDLIEKNILIKKNIVEQDEKEQGSRQLLNFGHTIGHAIETLENYRIAHGEAVAIGLLVESYLSVLYGYLENSVLKNLQSLLQQTGLVLQTDAFQDHACF